MTKILNTLFGITCILCIASIFTYNWVLNNGDKHIPIIANMFGTNTQVSDEDITLDPDTKFTYVVKYFRNIDNNGAEMLEIKQTSYTDYQMSAVYSTGIQIVNPGEISISKEQYYRDWIPFVRSDYMFKYVVDYSGDVSYFDSADGISFGRSKGLTSYNDDLYIIDIDGSPYAFNFCKQTKFKEYYQLWVPTRYYIESNFEYFMYQLYGTAKSLKQGIYNNLPMKFTDVFNLYEYNSTSGKFDKQSDIAQIDNYVSFRFYIYDRGVMTHSDSLFGQIGETAPGGVIYG